MQCFCTWTNLSDDVRATSENKAEKGLQTQYKGDCWRFRMEEKGEWIENLNKGGKYTNIFMYEP